MARKKPVYENYEKMCALLRQKQIGGWIKFLLSTFSQFDTSKLAQSVMSVGSGNKFQQHLKNTFASTRP